MFWGVTTNAPPSSSAAKARLSSRAQVIARLRHPNLVRMLPLPGGAGLVPVAHDARRLADFMLTSAPFKRFELEQAVRLMLDVLSGLSSLHEAIMDGAPLVHGDVCPEHVYVGEHGTAKLVPLTSWHARPGVKHEPNGYTAPELLRGDAVDARADLFSVGVMLWEALAGRRLFPENRAENVLARLRSEQLPKLTVPTRLIWAAPLCAIIERTIALDPALRPQTAMELSNAIAQAVGKHLAKVNGDAWQDEAPTPVFQPRLHLPHVRSTTPPATVIDIDIDNDNEVTQRAVKRAQPLRQTTPAPETPAAFAPFAAISPALQDTRDDELPSVRPPAGWLRASAFALSAVAIGAVAWLGSTQRSVAPSPAARPAAVATLTEPAVPAPAPTAPTAPLPSVTPGPPAGPPEATGAPASSASPAAAASSIPIHAKPARPAPPSKPKKALARSQSSDYGI